MRATLSHKGRGCTETVTTSISNQA
jgi:hypothetical protein